MFINELVCHQLAVRHVNNMLERNLFVIHVDHVERYNERAMSNLWEDMSR